MTPLAYRIVKDGLSREVPAQQRSYLRDLMFDVHCFDVTEVKEIASNLFGTFMRNPTEAKKVSDYFFLPAPKTWIECAFDEGNVMGFHLSETADNQAYLTNVHFAKGQSSFVPVGQIDFKTLRLTMIKGFGMGAVPYEGDNIYATDGAIRMVYAFLSLINTPRIIGRTQRVPQYSLEKKLTKNLGVGRFPLHAWTTIHLKVAKPIEIDDGEPHEAHLTGRRALHFCRAHVRIKNGRLEYVTSHWRGDPAIGIKQTRYTVTP